MSEASVSAVTRSGATKAGPTIRADEAAHFGALAGDWWDPRGSSAMLHRLNPPRLRFIRRLIDRHFATARTDLRPLAGRRVLDVGCGAGLLCEPLARLGGDVTGVDAAAESIAVARDHAAGQGLAIRYEAGEIADLDLGGRFDVVCALEVIEHVADPQAFLRALDARLADGGLLILSTPNRTAASRLLLVEAAELTGRIPRGTHHWDQFLKPDELTAMLAALGYEVVETSGIAFDPARGLHLSESVALNYMLGAVRG